MKRISFYTLIDITPTGVISQNKTDAYRRNQQRNWETIQQICNLRTHAVIVADPVEPRTVNLAHHQFGGFYSGDQKCWKCIFDFDTTDPLITDKLIYDFNQVPVIKGLEETVSLPDPLIYSSGQLKNLYFKVLE
jgi:hypothetical protein